MIWFILLDTMVKSHWLALEPFLLIWNSSAVWSHKFTNHLTENGKSFLNFYTFSVSQGANICHIYNLQYEQDISAVIQQW